MAVIVFVPLSPCLAGVRQLLPRARKPLLAVLVVGAASVAALPLARYGIGVRDGTVVPWQAVVLGAVNGLATCFLERDAKAE